MLRIIGLMSGTSLDGVDAAWVETDGEAVARIGPARTIPYDAGLRRDLRTLLDRAAGRGMDDPLLLDCTARLTARHAEAVLALAEDVAAAGLPPASLLGFHGQTILHRPRRAGDDPAIQGRTWQIGDAAALARATGCHVAHDFRTADVAAGGQGAPLVPVAHAALAQGLARPLAVLNLGGVGNVSWLGPEGALAAFDTGPANGPLDDWVRRRTGQGHDMDGRLAASGRVDAAMLATLLAHPILATPPPRSLDRLDFDAALREAGLERLSTADGAATLVAFAAGCVAAASRHFPGVPRRWLVGGGGRRNPALMQALTDALAEPVQPVEAVGWDGDALEAQCFAVLAARCARGLPLTFPGTTGAPHALAGGRIVSPP
jgi:anhydro-N-acetylmuramic acid kinase